MALRFRHALAALILLAAPGAALAQSAQVVTQAALLNSGVQPVSGTLTGTANSSVFTPAAGRNFHFALWVTGSLTPGSALGCTVYLATSIDGGTTYLPITANGTQLETFTTVASEQWSSSLVGASYELAATSCTSTVNYRFAQ